MVQKVVLETWKAQENSNRGWRFCIYWISHFFLFFWSAEKSICDFAAKIKHTHAYFQCVDDEVYTFTNPVLTIWPDAESYKYKYLQLFPNSRQRNKNTEMEIHYTYKPQLLCSCCVFLFFLTSGALPCYVFVCLGTEGQMHQGLYWPHHGSLKFF